jgi:hypothetical protein
MNSYSLYAVTIPCSLYVCCNMTRDTMINTDTTDTKFCHFVRSEKDTDLLLDPVENSFHRFTELSLSTATVCKVWS